MALRRLAFATCAAVVAGQAAVHACDGGACEEPEDTVLLQQHAGGQRRAPPAAAGQGEAGCENHCPMRNHVCVCNSGWAGEHCETAEELLPTEPAPDDAGDNGGDNASLVCDQGFTVYPYIEADRWGTNYQGWETCAGEVQSPINIWEWRWRWDSPKEGQPLKTSYGEPKDTIYVQNNGHALQVTGMFGPLQLRGVTYESRNFHFHTPSETRLNGRQFPLEMHIVNIADDDSGRAAVVAVLFEVGKHNECLDEVLGCDAPVAGCKKKVQPVDLGKCFKRQLSGPRWTFTGSLTTPPCTEGLAWNVMTRRTTISAKQLKNMRERYTDNARPAQRLYSRKVTYRSP